MNGKIWKGIAMKWTSSSLETIAKSHGPAAHYHEIGTKIDDVTGSRPTIPFFYQHGATGKHLIQVTLHSTKYILFIIQSQRMTP